MLLQGWLEVVGANEKSSLEHDFRPKCHHRLWGRSELSEHPISQVQNYFHRKQLLTASMSHLNVAIPEVIIKFCANEQNCKLQLDSIICRLH
ncbi:hypothetical protein SCLCIDRAFT_1212988 [Scleroderma citrinum Foug A]|uniref:Uncharacterized protein n=1 Tax=Scleroderma citrinum Foug A TaxID=1036808 RepID=A0A0C3AJ12_9AGAM|nr:hypothetical protein SCLCIDRAFT_1212988 [Scleroderma citrinum Foug A]